MSQIVDTPYEVEGSQVDAARALADKVSAMRRDGALSSEVLGRLRKYFRIKNIYHSNAIEGNSLDVGETRLVVEQGLTLTGKPLKDQAEARNLSHALDFLEELAKAPDRPITTADVRQIHEFVLRGIDDVNAGRYRSVPVEISGSKYKPTAPESLPAEMEAFGEWLQKSSIPDTLFGNGEAILAAAAAHTWFVMIHPFVDGNGRVGRLLMNLILMRYGYPIAVIAREDRLRYYDALEEAQSSDLTPFVALVNECIDESLEEYEAAAQEHRERIEWAASIVSKFDQKEKVRASNQYEVWKSAMDLLKSLFRQTAEMLNATAIGNIYFKDFGTLEFEKYLSLKNHGSAKRTWYFRVDFRNKDRAARYLFFFGSPSYVLRNDADVTLHVSREDPPGSFFYQRLDQITAPNVPNVVEVGYKQSSEIFVVRGQDNRMREEKADTLCRKFIQVVVDRHFGS
jgi:Fic family protein